MKSVNWPKSPSMFLAGRVGRVAIGILSAGSDDITMACALKLPLISTDDLFDLVFLSECGREYMAMLYQAAIDDSADSKRERIIVASAVIGDRIRWQHFDKRWRERLAQDEIAYFKSGHCDTLNGQFHKYREYGIEEGKRLTALIRDDLDAIIHDCQLVCIGVTLSVPFHQKMLADPGKFGPIPEVPYRLAFQQLMAECGKAMNLLGRGNMVSFAHDDGNDYPILHEMYKKFRAANRRYQRTMVGFVPLDDKLFTQVQAADLAASVTRKYAEDYVLDPSPDNMKRLRASMYKIVNWIDGAVLPARDTEEAAAKATYIL